MYHRILFPTDGSPEMDAVVEHARRLAETHESEIHALYVVDTGRFATLPVESSWDGLSAMLREEGETALEHVADAVGDDVPLEQSILEGDPGSEIVAYATEHDCDAVVMGTHGRGGIDRLLLGSVAERVVRRSSIPVVTVPVE